MARVRYLTSDEAPKLLAAAIAMGVNGVTDASPEAEKLAAINKLQDDTEGFTNAETNIFLEEFGNKVLLQAVFRRVTFKDPLNKAFFTEGTSFSAAKEVIDSKLLESHKFDKSKRYPDKQTFADNLQTLLKTQAREYITNTVPLAGIRAAFASEQAYGTWLAKQVSLLQESLQVIMFTELTKAIESGVKNTITLDSTKYNSWDKIFVAINGIAKNMKLPSKKYNLGYADAATAEAATDSRTNISSRENLYMLGSTEIENSLEGEVSTVKFHNAYFDIAKYKGYISLDVPTDHVILADQSAFDGYWRVNEVATQMWAGNLTVEYFLHFWYVFGAIRWANAVRIEFTNPNV